MENTRRRLLNESNTDTGSIVDEMKSYSKAPVTNDGINVYGNVRINPITSGPFQTNQEIELPITNTSFDVIEFSNSYIHLETIIHVRCTNPPVMNTPSQSDYQKDGADDTEAYENSVKFHQMLAENQYVMIGLKASPHMIRDYKFKFNGNVVSSTTQSDAVYESFLYSTFKAKSEIENKKYVFSPYVEASQLDNSICGIYVPLSKLTTSGVYLNLDIIIPIRELLCMEAFYEFPTKIFGELRLLFHTTPEAFVYTEVNPITSLRKGIITGKIDKSLPYLSEILAVDKDTLEYQHSYEQVGIASPAQFISGWDNANSKLTFSTQSEFMPYIDDLIVKEAWCDAKGYRMSDAALRELIQHYSSNPFTVCAQKVETHTMPSGPGPDGLRTNLSFRINHCTDFEILHPTNSKQRTIFRNIMHDNYVVQIGNIRYPEQLVSTISPEYHEMMIQASDFDSVFVANDEYEHSLTDPRTDGENILKPTTDNTSWVPIFQTERSGSGSEMWFDGIDYPNVKVEINTRPLYATSDVYYQGSGTPAPIFCATSEAYWIFRLIDGKPNCQYVTQNTYEEGYNNPAIGMN